MPRSRFFFRIIALPIVITLLVFNIRRLLFSLTTLWRREHSHPKRGASDDFPDILVLVPCRDEEAMIRDLCAALNRIDYPAGKWRVVLINDGSRDSTLQVMEQCTINCSDWSVLSLETNVGKADALNRALTCFPFGEIIYVLDADHRPQPDVLKLATSYFHDESVAGITGFSRVANPFASATTYYATVESYINQMVTMRAKELLGLAPALLGSNCFYRRTTLDQCGGFPSGALSEDSNLTITFYRAGYRLHFAADIISHHQVPHSLKGYLSQHRRWARGLNDVARTYAYSLVWDRRLSLPLRTELLLFSAGYLDRIAFTAAGMLTLLSFKNPRRFSLMVSILFGALITPLLQVVAMLVEQRMAFAMWLRLPIIPAFFVFDILAAIQATIGSLLHHTLVWTKTERKDRHLE